MRILFKIIILFNLSVNLVTAQQDSVEVNFTYRVDTSKKEIKEVLNLWINYLKSRPDSTYDNPYWNEAEKEFYIDKIKMFDRSAFMIYNGNNANKVLTYYKPTVLSISPVENKYLIRTLFYADSLIETHKQYRWNPPWITRVYAIVENGEWRLQNSIIQETKYWRQNNYKYINFISHPNHSFNPDLAEKSIRFCDSIVKEFNVKEVEPFDYYITTTEEEMGKLYNFDYWLSYHTGFTHVPIRQIVTARNNEYFPHEFIHLLFHIEEGNPRHIMVNEGLATYLGGTGENPFNIEIREFANEIYSNDTLTFNDILTKKYIHKYDNTPFYLTGAVICKLTYEKKGVKGIKQLLKCKPDDEMLYNLITELLGIKREKIEHQIIEEIKKYFDK